MQMHDFLQLGSLQRENWMPDPVLTSRFLQSHLYSVGDLISNRKKGDPTSNFSNKWFFFCNPFSFTALFSRKINSTYNNFNIKHSIMQNGLIFIYTHTHPEIIEPNLLRSLSNSNKSLWFKATRTLKSKRNQSFCFLFLFLFFFSFCNAIFLFLKIFLISLVFGFNINS